MQLGHLLTRSVLTYPEVSSKVYHDSFCQSNSIVSLPWAIYFEAFYLHFVSSFSCIPVICPKLMLFLNPLQFVHLFSNLSKCILLLFSCISSLLLLFFFPRDLPVVKISPELVTGPELVKSSGRIATFSLWTGMFRDGISSIPGKQFYRCDSVVISAFVRIGYTTRRWGWLLGRIDYRITVG